MNGENREGELPAEAAKNSTGEAGGAALEVAFAKNSANPKALPAADQAQDVLAKLKAELEGESAEKGTAERVLRELARIAFADPRELMTWSEDGLHVRPSEEISAEAAALVAEVRESRDGVTLKLLDKAKALELLGKHLGLFKEKVEMSGKLDIAEELMQARERAFPDRRTARGVPR